MMEWIQIRLARRAPAFGKVNRSAGSRIPLAAQPAAWLSFLIGISLLLLVPRAMIAQAKTANEYEVKAAFLYNFAKFVEWPASAWSSPKQPFTFCVLGKDPFGSALDDAVVGKTIADRPISVVRAGRIKDLPECQIVFVSTSESLKSPEILAGLRGRNVLVVGEAEDFACSGGTIQFVLEGNHVRFAINPDAAERAKLKISSKLLALAVVVRDAGRAEGVGR